MAHFGGDTSGLMALEARLRNVAKTGAKQLGTVLASQIQYEIDGEFRGGHGPDGRPWAPKKPISGSGPTLVGESLSATAKAVFKGRAIEATIGGRAYVHQKGMTIYPVKPVTIGMYGKRAGGVLAFNGIFAKNVTIPARQMLPPDAELPSTWEASMQRAAGFKLEELLRT